MPKFTEPKTKQMKCYYIFDQTLWDDIVVTARIQGYTGISRFCRAAVEKAIMDSKRHAKLPEKEILDRISRGYLVNCIQREYKIPVDKIRESLNKARQLTKRMIVDWRKYLQRVQDEEKAKDENN